MEFRIDQLGEWRDGDTTGSRIADDVITRIFSSLGDVANGAEWRIFDSMLATGDCVRVYGNTIFSVNRRKT